MYKSGSNPIRNFHLGPNEELSAREAVPHLSKIAYRKTCNPLGTGLSHYILLADLHSSATGQAGGLHEHVFHRLGTASSESAACSGRSGVTPGADT